MDKYNMYRYFKGEKANPFDKVNQNTQHMFWFYESCFEQQFSDNESSDWYDFFGGADSKVAKKFTALLSAEDYERPGASKKAAIFDIWLNDYLFVEKLYGEYGGDNEYKTAYLATSAR